MNNKNSWNRSDYADVLSDVTIPLFLFGTVVGVTNAAGLELNTASADNLFNLGTHENFALIGFSFMLPQLILMLLTSRNNRK